MPEHAPVEMLVQLENEDGDREELDRLTRHLLAELRDQPVEHAGLAPGAAVPQGAKATETISLGVIALAFAPQLLPFVIDFLRSWYERQRKRQVRISGTVNGQEIDFTGSEADLAALVRTLSRTIPPEDGAS